jgi:hypothetical protein
MVLVLDEEQSAWLSRMQADWYRIMKPFSPTEGWGEQFIKRGNAFLPIPRLEPRHMSNAKLVPSREALLELLPKGGVIGEVGTGHGDFAKKINDVNHPVELHLFDVTFEYFDLACLLSAPDVVRKHPGDSATNLSMFPDGYFDWLYIDANHTYLGVKRDIEQAVQKIKPSGFLIFNDFTFWSPIEAMSYGVAHAVCELCLSRDWEIIYLALEPFMYCDVVVRPRVAGERRALDAAAVFPAIDEQAHYNARDANAAPSATEPELQRNRPVRADAAFRSELARVEAELIRCTEQLHRVFADVQGLRASLDLLGLNFRGQR